MSQRQRKREAGTATRECNAGATQRHGIEVMTAAHFRATMPEAWRKEYEDLLATVQRYAEQRSRDIKAVVWRGLTP